MSVVTVEARGPATVISINRPEKLNAINKQVAIDLMGDLPADVQYKLARGNAIRMLGLDLDK